MKTSGYLGMVLALAGTLIAFSLHSETSAHSDYGNKVKIDAFVAAASRFEDYGMDGSARTIVVANRDRYVVVSFLNVIPQRRSEPHFVYDPEKKIIVSVLGDW